MIRIRASLLICALAAASCATAPSAPPARAPEARNPAAAEVLFDEAVALTETGKYAEACTKFADSDRIDHAINTLFNLADCYERTGRLGSAWQAFTRVADEASRTGKGALKEQALKRSEAIKPRLAKLEILVPAAVAGLDGVEIRNEGALVERAFWNHGLPVDAGEQNIVVSAPGKASWRGAITVKEAESARLDVPELADAAMPGQRVGALAAGGVGVAGLIVGGIFGGLAFSKWSAALKACGGPAEQHAVCPTEAQATSARELSGQASTFATVSNIGLIAGGLGLGAAGILWFTAPKSTAPARETAWQLRIELAGPEGLGGGVRGTF